MCRRQQGGDTIRREGLTTPPEEGALVHLDGFADDLDRPHQGFFRQRQQPALPGEADEEDVRGDRCADQRRRKAGRVTESRTTGRRLLDRLFDRRDRQREIGIAGEIAGIGLGRVDDDAGFAGPYRGESLGGA